MKHTRTYRAAIIVQLVAAAVSTTVVASCGTTDTAPTSIGHREQYLGLSPVERAEILGAAIRNPGRSIRQLVCAVAELNSPVSEEAFDLAMLFIERHAPDLAREFHLHTAQRSPPRVTYPVELAESDWIWNSVTMVYEPRRCHAATLRSLVAAIHVAPVDDLTDAFGTLDVRWAALRRLMDASSDEEVVDAWAISNANVRGNMLAAANGVRIIYLQLALWELQKGGAAVGPVGRAVAFVCQWAPQLADRLDIDPMRLDSPSYRAALVVEPEHVPSSASNWVWNSTSARYIPAD